MATTNTFNITDLDFNDIEESFRNYLLTKYPQVDSSFAGSGWALPYRPLSYNTTLNAFYLNMVASEMFIDSAQLRGSVSSLAKLLGYLPRSKESATAKISVTFTLQNPAPLNPIYIDRNTLFTSNIDGTTYIFQPTEAHTVYPDINQNYSISELDLIEGDRLTYQFVVNNNDTEQRFILPNLNVDTSTISVTVQDSIYSLGLTAYSLANDITTLKNDSKVYYLQETGDGYYEIYFGDDILSYMPKTGNIVIVEYIVSNGTAANGIQAFEAVAGVGTITGNIITSNVITVTQPSASGKDEESIDSVKKFSPQNLQVQNRGVTVGDYEFIILRDYPNVASVSVWGGETNVPPIYGSVFFAVKPTDGFIMSDTDKGILKNDIIANIATLSQNPVIVDPVYTFISTITTVKYNYYQTYRTQNEIQQDVITAITSYGTNVLSVFKSDFIFSDFISMINAVNPAIISSSVIVEMRQRIFPTLGIKQQYTFNFNNTLDVYNSNDFYGKSVRSTEFTFQGNTCFLAEQTFGSTVLSIFAKTTSGLKELTQIGTIDYSNGIVSVNLFVPDAWIGSLNYIDLFVKPKAFDITPARDQILVIEQQDVSVVVNQVR